MSKNADFKPLPILSGCHEQTILGSFINFHKPPPSKTWYHLLDDGDCLTLEISTPKGWKKSDPTVVMVHGLGGSHRSAYLVRLSNKLYRMGIRAARLNLRGAGSSRGMARHMYHWDSSGDMRSALRALKKEEPASPISLIGFSLGGNFSLKLAGELSKSGEELLGHVIGVSPPAELITSSRMMSQLENRIYERYFLKLLRTEALFRSKIYGDYPKVPLDPNMTLYDFDDTFTGPHMGLSGAFEYYQKSSCKPLIPHIAMPCEILYSVDDPIIDAHALDDTTLPDHVRVFKTNHGGHMGFLGTPSYSGGFRWMDMTLFNWLFPERI